MKLVQNLRSITVFIESVSYEKTGLQSVPTSLIFQTGKMIGREAKEKCECTNLGDQRDKSRCQYEDQEGNQTGKTRSVGGSEVEH